MKEIILYILSSSSIVYLVIQWWMKQREKREDKREKTESEIVTMLRNENIELQKTFLKVQAEVQELRKELHLAEIKVQKYEQGVSLILDVIKNLKSINVDERIIVDAIVKNLQPS